MLLCVLAATLGLSAAGDTARAVAESAGVVSLESVSEDGVPEAGSSEDALTAWERALSSPPSSSSDASTPMLSERRFTRLIRSLSLSFAETQIGRASCRDRV